MLQLFLKLLALITRSTSWVEGKGYGSNSIKQEVRLCCKLLGRIPRLVIDMGGNRGDYAAAIRGLSTKVEIHIFEPSVKNIQYLKERFINDEGIVICPLAVSDREGGDFICRPSRVRISKLD